MNNLYIIDGWLKQARVVKSPNFNQRPENTSINAIIIHGISLPPGQFGSSDIDDFFSNQLDVTKHPFYNQIADLQVSAHFLIRRDGEIVQYVSTNERAWHAGVSRLAGKENCNDFSIGIELEGTDDSAYELSQYKNLVAVIKCLIKEYPSITKERIVGHEHVAPGRKTDPGPLFDWDLFWQEINLN